MMIIIEYIRRLLPYMLIALPFYIAIRYIIVKLKRDFKFNLFHELGLLIFIIFIFWFLSLTIRAKLPYTFSFKGSINLIPFKTILKQIKGLFEYNQQNNFLINILGNVAMFIPIGFFPALLYEKANIKVSLLSGFLLSLFIECLQLILPRTTDIDDIILNTIGALLGYLIYKLIAKSKFIRKFKYHYYN